MQMKVLFTGQVPKEPDFPDDIEDAIAQAADDSRIVISDGASESYDSKTWARLLTARFRNHPELSQSWLTEAIVSYTARFDYANLSWSKQAAFARGSFATLLATIKSEESDAVNIFSVGDSLAVFLDNGELLESFPYIRAEEFQQRPELLCTNIASNAFLFSSDFAETHHKIWLLQDKSNPVILCMTDALGEWALRHQEEGDPRWLQLAQIRDAAELESLVLQERESKSLRVDDVTLVNISLIGCTKDELPDP